MNAGENAFEAWLRSQDKAASTIRAYTIALEQFATWFRQTNGKALTPAAITPLDVKEWRSHLRTVRKLATSTVNLKLAAVRSYTDWAKAADKIQTDPANGIKMLKRTPAPPRWLTRSQQFALLRAAQEATQLGYLKAQGRLDQPSAIWSRRNEAILVLLLNTGLRLSEAEALDLSDVEINERSGSIHVRQGKGRKERHVPLNHDARTALLAWLKVRPDEEIDALFISQKGGRLSSRAIARAVKKIAERAGLDDVSPHTLRHSFAKNLVDADVGLEKVATLLGHESLDTTRIYTQPSKADLQAATEKVAWQDD
jgi:site-specific recombinase XerD